MSLKLTFTCLLFLSYLHTVKAQEDAYIKDILESVAENLPEDVDIYELTERLTYLRSHPLDLNATSSAKLKQLVFLSPLQINNLVRHLDRNGKILDLTELQAIEGFDQVSINRLLPFVKIEHDPAGGKISAGNLIKSGNGDLMLRYGRGIEVPKGFTNLSGSRYLGTQDKALVRFKYAYSTRMTAGLVLEKDAGEYFANKGPLADHISANITFNELGRVKKLIVGDYSLQFGQGLTLWSGFGFGKGPDVTSVAARDLGLRPYSSSNESSFFRGVATTLSLWKKTELTSFVSYRKRDASLKTWPDSAVTLQNINETGYHRTKTELNNQNSLGQLVYGSAIQYLSNNLNVGIVGYHTTYDKNFITGTSAYNQYGFIGKNLSNVGLHYSYTLKNIYSYGEVARSLNGGWGIVNGLLISLSPKVSTVLLHRNYDRNYHSFFSNTVGENTDVANEKGIYAGINYMPNKRFLYSAYYDYFRFPWLKFRVDSASSGHEFLLQAVYTPKKTFKVLLRLKQELKQQNPDADDSSPGLRDVLKTSVRGSVDWSFSPSLSVQHRIEISIYKKGTAKQEMGKLVYSDFNYHRPSTKVSCNLRIAYFATPSYNSRIYAYEDDVLYGASFGAYSDKGFKTYGNIRYRVTKNIDLWTRYSIIIYRGKEVISSGLDEIQGNKKSDVKLQIRYQF